MDNEKSKAAPLYPVNVLTLTSPVTVKVSGRQYHLSVGDQLGVARWGVRKNIQWFECYRAGVQPPLIILGRGHKIDTAIMSDNDMRQLFGRRLKLLEAVR
jgi:hypothetical protein